jgi:hypothetical protein
MTGALAHLALIRGGTRGASGPTAATRSPLFAVGDLVAVAGAGDLLGCVAPCAPAAGRLAIGPDSLGHRLGRLA